MKDKQVALKREMGISDVVTNVLSISIGSGIFLLPALVYVILGHGSILAYIFCGLIFLSIGLCFGELSNRIPETGGLYAYIDRAFGPLAGFVATMLYVFGIGVLVSAALLNAMIDILSTQNEIFKEPTIRFLFFTIILGLISFLSIRGMKDSMVLIKTLTWTKVLAIVSLIVFGISKIEIANIAWEGFPSFSKIGEGSILLIFAFMGGEFALSTGGEMKDPKRTGPLGFLFGIIGAILIFCLIHLVTQGVLGDRLLENQEAPLAELAQNLFGSIGFAILLIVTFIAVWSTFSSIFILKNRILYAASKDEVIPKLFSRLHPKYQTPIVAILFLGILDLLVAMSGSFQYLLILVTAGMLVIYLGGLFAFLKFRLTAKSTDSVSFKVPGGYLVAIFGIVAMVWVFIQISQEEMLAIGAFLAIAIILYYILNYFKTKKKGLD